MWRRVCRRMTPRRVSCLTPDVAARDAAFDAVIERRTCERWRWMNERKKWMNEWRMRMSRQRKWMKRSMNEVDGRGTWSRNKVDEQARWTWLDEWDSWQSSFPRHSASILRAFRVLSAIVCKLGRGDEVPASADKVLATTEEIDLWRKNRRRIGKVKFQKTTAVQSAGHLFERSQENASSVNTSFQKSAFIYNLEEELFTSGSILQSDMWHITI